MIILIQVSPSLKIIGDKVLRVNESDDVKIACVGESYPKNDLMWRFIVNNISTVIHDTIYYNNSKTNNTLVLVLNNIEKSQQGYYECSTQDKNTILKQIVQIIVQSI